MAKRCKYGKLKHPSGRRRCKKAPTRGLVARGRKCAAYITSGGRRRCARFRNTKRTPSRRSAYNLRPFGDADCGCG